MNRPIAKARLEILAHCINEAANATWYSWDRSLNHFELAVQAAVDTRAGNELPACYSKAVRNRRLLAQLWRRFQKDGFCVSVDTLREIEAFMGLGDD